MRDRWPAVPIVSDRECGSEQMPEIPFRRLGPAGRQRAQSGRPSSPGAASPARRDSHCRKPCIGAPRPLSTMLLLRRLAAPLGRVQRLPSLLRHVIRMAAVVGLTTGFQAGLLAANVVFLSIGRALVCLAPFCRDLVLRRAWQQAAGRLVGRNPRCSDQQGCRQHCRPPRRPIPPPRRAHIAA